MRVREEALELLRTSGVILPQRELTRMVNEVSDEVVGFGPIEYLLKEPDVTEVIHLKDPIALQYSLMAIQAAIYVRISKDSTGERAGVERQEKDCRALAETRGWDVTGVYSDNDTSAWSGKKRPEYERMLADIRSGKITAIVAWHLDRLTRSPKELESFLDDCASAGVKRFGTVSGDIDLGSRDGIVMARILGAIARKSSDDASARIRAKFDEKAAVGQWKATGYPPYGYDQVDGTLVIRKEEANLIREAAKRVLAGESRTAIIREFHARGLRTSTGKAWSLTRLAEVLRSPTITGLRIHRGEVMGEGNWEPILEREVWERVGKQLRRSGSAPRGRRRHLLTGTIICGRCGQRLFAKRRSDGTRVYKCPSDSAAACGSLSVVADPVERIAADTAFANFDFGKVGPQVDTSEDAEVQAAQDRLQELAEAEADITEQRINGPLRGTAFVQAIQMVAAERTVLENQLSSLERKARPLWTLEATQVLIGPPDTFSRLHPDEIEWWRDLLGTVFKEIIIEPAGKGSRFRPERIRLVPREGFEGAATPVLREGEQPFLVWGSRKGPKKGTVTIHKQGGKARVVRVERSTP
ncbi:MAG: recombinase family protein [Actinomycetota bacterium]|nr:recombinase family protein [Actinomycetota bacterium]